MYGVSSHCHGMGKLYDRLQGRFGHAENFLFGNAGLSFKDLNNKGIVVFTVKWPKRSYIPFLSVHACCLV